MGMRPVVLIARLETDKTVYVLERQDEGLYTLCMLGAWVDLESLSKCATVAYSKLIKPRSPAPQNTESEPTITLQLHHENKKRRLAIEAIQSLVKKPARSRSFSLPSQNFEVTQVPTPVENDSPSQANRLSEPREASTAPAESPLPPNPPTVTPAPDKAVAQPSVNDIFENVRNQYFEALYNSMGSLAYFAKGPLSRARAAFHLDCDSNLDMNDLIDFLKGLVLTTVQIDKKYRETIPSIVAKMKTFIPDSEDEHGPKSKRRKAQKMKLGKDGLYPAEDEHIRKWWDARKPQPKDDDSVTTTIPQQESRAYVSYLRTRETQLQMILILEILALEPLRPADKANPSLPGDESQPTTVNESARKKRNKHNLPILIDVHADRLSIWQSTALEEIRMLDDSQTVQAKDAQKSLRPTNDPLKDFCIDIIVPFFASRLPEQCDLLNRKLGGPVMPSQPKVKPKTKKVEPAAKPKTKPGAVTKRTGPKSSRTLESVLSKESARNRRSMSRGPSGVIALMRSASMTPSIPILKWEASEPLSLPGVPKKDSRPSSAMGKAPNTPAELGSAKRKTEEEKLQREVQIQAELRDAISSLRKPNRDVVGKAMAEAAERRATTSLSQLRKSKKPTQHPGFHDNVVKATPIGNGRFRDALARDAHSQPVTSLKYESIENDHVPSSASMIPSSGPRKRKANAAFPLDSSPALPTFKRPVDQVDATPVKSSNLRRNILSVRDEGVILASSPVARQVASQPNLLSVPSSSLRHRDSGIEMPSTPARRGGIAETPVKRARVSLENFVTVTPANKRVVDDVGAAENVAAKEKERARQMSIYEKLGWDDDEDDLA